VDDDAALGLGLVGYKALHDRPDCSVARRWDVGVVFAVGAASTIAQPDIGLVKNGAEDRF
jgi:hypothetical protein